MSAWLSMARPSVRPFSLTTSYHMGSRSPSSITPHTKRGCSINRATNLPVFMVGDGEVRSALTPDATTP